MISVFVVPSACESLLGQFELGKGATLRAGVSFVGDEHTFSLRHGQVISQMPANNSLREI